MLFTMLRFKIHIPKGLRHAAWGIADTAIYPVAYLATVPMLMHSLGAEGFGLWILLNTVITTLQMFNINAGIANMGVITVRGLTAAEATAEQRNEVFNATLSISILLMVFAIMAGAMLAGTTAGNAIWGRANHAENIAAGILLASGTGALKYVDQVLQTTIKAYHHFRTAAVLNMLNRFGALVVCVWLANRYHSIALVFGGYFIFTALYIALQLAVTLSTIKGIRLARFGNYSQYGRLLRSSLVPWLQAAIIALAFQTDKFWVAAFAGLRQVSCYGLVSTMFNHIHMIFTAMVLWMMPRMASMTSRGDDPKRLYDTVHSTLISLTIIALLAFYALSPTLLPAWVGQENYELMKASFKSFIAFELLFAQTIMPLLYLNAAGQSKQALYSTLLICLPCYLFMIGGLYAYHSPASMVNGMSIALGISAPVVTATALNAMQPGRSKWQALSEVLPTYMAIALLYSPNRIWLYSPIAVALALLIGKKFIPSVNQIAIWKPRA